VRSDRLLDVQGAEGQLALKDRALSIAAEGITIADARLPDMPLIYANTGFERLTGYAVADVLRRNCRFLQGTETDPEAADEIRHAIREERECVVEILNYRKDGSSFWNRLSITPVRDDAGLLTHFIGVQSDVTARRRAEEELQRASGELERVNQRMRTDLEAAARIQRSLLPSQLPSFPGLRLAWDFRPCRELAGDMLDVIPLGEHHVGFYVADVSGKGVPAALLSVTLSHTLSAIPEPSCLLTRPGPSAPYVPTSPALVAATLNRQFQMERGRVQYFTMFYGVLDLRSRMLRFVSAGHPPAIVVPREGQPSLLAFEGFAVGLLEEAHYEERQHALEPGDRLYVYTDGVNEAEREPEGELGVERLRVALHRARAEPLEESVAGVRGLVEEWCEDGEPADDVSVLALEVTTDTARGS
jgi:sigma-B regulation protein RsbU (phosphoserine phosphatase)